MFADASPVPFRQSPPAVLSLPRMARRLAIPQRELKRMAETGLLPSLPVGRTRLFAVTATELAVARMAAAGTEVPVDPNNPPPRAA